MDLTLTSLHVSALSSNSEGVLTMIEEGEHCTPQHRSLGRAIMPVQGSENRRCSNGLGPGHSSVREGLRTFGSAQLDVSNNRAEKNTLRQTEVTENFFSLSDQSRDSEDPNAGSSTDLESYSSSIPSTISMTGQSVMQCREGATEADLAKTKQAKTNKKRKKKKSVNRATAISWDYTDTQQFQHNSDNVFKGPRDPVTDSVGDCAPPSLYLIYQTMMVQHKQIQGDNKKARLASKQLQVAVSKIAKTCSEVGERIATIETCTSVLEAELGTVAQQSTKHESQLIDIQWKLEDFENRQRRNNLSILGIQEGAEGQDTRAFIFKVFKTAFPELASWDWKKEIQGAHRLPLCLKKERLAGEATMNQPQLRAIIVYFGNYLLRQAVFEKARPDLKSNCESFTFFNRPDYCHATVERRWRLHQMILPFHEKEAEAYLLHPACLKTIYKGAVRVFSSEIKAKEYLQTLTSLRLTAVKQTFVFPFLVHWTVRHMYFSEWLLALDAMLFFLSTHFFLGV
ncbi:hypothetical protein NDU88_006798 [Pleurodeles waltl]|uniref:Uncharacterized protein n=1 Tax=Pleurodeles waltl TaxID=8319 RepID=A0AAV7N0G9_PLEWA|nr:hypothetical protein NDU88_006798 [Pleurodeles waltl]